MAEVLVNFDTELVGPDGTRWTPSACGGVAADGLWEGWIEFTPLSGAHDPIRTPRETQQPNRADLMYWAQGLTHVYLESALTRALQPPRPYVAAVRATPHFDAPAPRFADLPPAPLPRAVLDPFAVYHQGERVLLSELAALDIAHLRDIVVGYGVASAEATAGLPRESLTALILSAVRGTASGAQITRDATP